MPRVLRGSYGGGRFLMGEVPLYFTRSFPECGEGFEKGLLTNPKASRKAKSDQGLKSVVPGACPPPCTSKSLQPVSLQEYLAHKKSPPPQDHHRALCIGLE